MHICITGGTRGIGNALAREFVLKGHKVTFTGTSRTSVEKSGLEGTSSKGFVLDVRNKADIEGVARQAVETFGPIDIWINNAGVPQHHHHVTDIEKDVSDAVLDVNIKGMVYGTQVAISIMRQQERGIVYNMEGLGSNGMIIAGEVVYGGTKRFVRYFSKGAAKELQGSNVYVGTLQPGMVFTSFLLDNMTEEGMTIARILGSHPEEVAHYLVKRMLKGKRHITYLSNVRMMLRFLKYPFIHQNKEVKST
jgi:NADP-dependent 3-hydroxy acid dehydrogenase YdfG